MKGYVYYSKDESVRNYKFIEDLVHEAELAGIDLQLIVDDEQPDSHADFILFRDRNPEKAKTFEQQGFRVINRAEVNRIANDKWLTYELALLLGIPTVPTKLVTLVEDIAQYPIVLKTVDGHGGTEVELCKDSFAAFKFLTAHKLRKIIAQPYIKTSAQDVRVFVIGEEVVGAVKRTGNGSFKSNYTLGGSVEKYTLSSWQEKESITIAKALKSDYIGIDFLLLPDGRWVLNEIEDPVGARSLYATHGFSVAKLVMAYTSDKYY